MGWLGSWDNMQNNMGIMDHGQSWELVGFFRQLILNENVSNTMTMDDLIMVTVRVWVGLKLLPCLKHWTP